MIAITSFEDVRAYINRIRSLRRGFITNFFPDSRKIEIWIKHQSLYVDETNEVILFIKNDDGFKYVFYCATNKDALNEVLSAHTVDSTYIFDQLVDARTDTTLIRSFIENGFTIWNSLIRMSWINEKTALSEVDESFDATVEDLYFINDMLHTYFDKYSEQLPTKEELNDFLELNHVIIYRKNAEIAGFILYDQTPSTLYLRYWLVNPKFRNQGIGSHLFKEYQKRGSSCKRHILWVVEDNINAIERYKHYGYQFENMKDYIMCKNI